MHVYVPSRSRFSRSLTLEALQGAWPKEQTFLVVPKAQAASYATLARHHAVTLLPCPAEGIAKTRQFCGQHAKDKFLMLDDDLRFFHRPTGEDVRLYKFDDPAHGLRHGMKLMLRHVSELLQNYAHVAVSAREGNNRLPWPLEECNRPLRALAYRRRPFLQCAHGRVAIMEDFDVTLQLLKAGHKNAITTRFAQDQVQTQMAGGCSDYRTHELHQKNVVKMAKLHDPYVKLRWKENKGGGEFGRRQEATIYWKKAWEAAREEWL